ncbi:MAG: heme-dependent peroxidase, partial [Limisphaerales bacterium]
MALPSVKLTQGIHAIHLFYRIDRVRWSQLPPSESQKSRERLEALCTANNNASSPSLRTYVNVGGKADL